MRSWYRWYLYGLQILVQSLDLYSDFIVFSALIRSSYVQYNRTKLEIWRSIYILLENYLAPVFSIQTLNGEVHAGFVQGQIICKVPTI